MARTDSAVVGVVDENLVKHYAYIPDDSKDPFFRSRGTYCGKDAGQWENAETLEELRSIVEGLSGRLKTAADTFVSEKNRQVALFMLKGIQVLVSKVPAEFFNYHSGMCKTCVQELNSED